MKFENRVALVTGGTGNIGQAICRKLARYGVRVAVTDVDQQKVHDFAEQLRQEGGTVSGYVMDISSMESCRKAVAQILKDFGKIDILVNNAGIWRRARQISLLEMDEDFWKQSVDVNLTGTYRVTKQVLPSMLEQQYGRIINLASIAGEVGLPGFSDYAAAKAGIIVMTKTLAMEVAKENITVNSVSPGLVSDIPGEVRPSNGTWLGRSGERDEIAEAVIFLASDNSSFITGADMPVDGGRILGPRFADFKMEYPS